MMRIKIRYSISNLFLIITFVLLPLLDQLSGAFALSGPSLSLYLRLIIMMAAFLFMIKEGYGNFIYIYLLILILLISAFIDYINISSSERLFKNIILVAKTIYPIIMFHAFSYISEKRNEDYKNILNYLITGILIYCIFMIITNVLGIGAKAYSAGGSTGFMEAGNDLSLSIAISFPLVFWEIEKRTKLKNLTIILVIILALSLLMTKSSLLALGFFFLIAIKMFFDRADKGYKFVFVLFLIALLIAIIYFINQLLKSLKVFELYYGLFSSQGLIWVLFRGRQAILYTFDDLINFAGPLRILFGMGQETFAYTYAKLSFEYWGSTYKVAEMDVFDLFFIFGLTGFVFIFSFYIKNSVKVIKENRNIIIAASIFTFFIHSIFAGHAMSSPIVGTYIAAILTLRKGVNI